MEQTIQRMALVAPNSWNEETRTATIVISTDADVGDGFQLLHTPGAIRWPSRPLPMDYDHKRSSDSIWGAVTDLSLQRQESGVNALVGTLVVDGPDAAVSIALPRLRTGSARFSVDARIYQHREDRSSNMLAATDWEPAMVSLVTIGQDPRAIMRADLLQQNTHAALRPMTDELKAGGDPAVIDAQRAADPAPVAPPAPPVAAATAEPQEDPAALRRELKIRKAAQMAELTADQTEAILASGKGVDEAQIEIIRQIRLRHEGPNQGAIDGRQPAPVVTRDQGDTLLRGIGEALEARVRPGAKVSDLGREYRGFTLLEYARMYLDSRGVNTRGMSKTELVTRGFHSTSDFPLLFSNLAGKSLDAAYAEEPHTWRGIARQRNLPDFKLASDLVIGADLTPEALLEGGEYKAGTLQEAQAQWRLATYARKVTVTRQAIINDDLSALERVPEMLGRGFRRLESNLVWGLITGNAVTSVDGQVLFHSTHNNYAASAASINTAGMNAMVKLLRKQTDIAGTTVNLRPSYMMVPTDLEATALQFLFPNGFMANTRTGENGPVTVQSAGIELIVEPRLDGAATIWYLAAAPTSIEGIVYGYLAGEEGPTVTTTEKRDPDGVELLARFDFGCAVKDYRFIARSATV